MKKILLAVAVSSIAAGSASAATIYEKDGFTYKLNGDFQVQMRQAIAEVIAHVILKFQIIKFNFGILISTWILTELNLEIAVQFVGKTVFFINGCSAGRTCRY